jgi:hypothetical protein
MAEEYQKIRCRRTSSQTGQPCKNWAIKGAEVCRFHGGSAPQVKAKAKERLAERAIAKTLGRLDITPVDNPLTALAELAGEILAWKQLAAERVALLESLARENLLIGNEDVRAEVQVFERAMDRAVTVLATIARLNIDERLAKISEQQAALVREALNRALADAGVPREQQRETVTHLARHLRVVAG